MGVIIALSLSHTLCSSSKHVLNHLSLLCHHQSLSGIGLQCHVHSFMSSLAVTYHTAAPKLTNWPPTAELTRSAVQSHTIIAAGPHQHSRSWFRALLGLMTIYLFYSDFHMLWNGVSSLTRGRVWWLLVPHSPLLGSYSAESYSHSLWT
jgi:hypothetical protein